jgi:uncharacterized protein (TIGR02118 family)
MRAWAFIVALLSPLAVGADGAQPQAAAPAMIKFVSIWEQPNDDATLDKWYRATHSREVLLFVGPWLRRYWAYKSLDVPAEADRFNVVRYRLTEMWYDSVAARNESRAVFYPLSPPPVDRERYPTRTRIANIYVSAVPTDAYIDGWPRSRAAYTRWVFFVRYPNGVRSEDGDKWFMSVHAPELSRLPGLRRFVCFRAVEAPRPDSWARMCEMWFDDYAAWKQAILTAPPVFTPPQWGGSFPFTDMISTFTPTEPDMDFRRDSDGPR